MQNTNKVSDSVIELLELSSINSPYTQNLVTDHRQRLVKRLLKTNKIDSDTADYLLN